jgi:flagellar basal body rod protein FlgG
VNYGLYLSASGVLTNLYRQDVFANNLANVETVGFKADLAAISQRKPETLEDHLSADLSNKLLEQLGGGVLAAAPRTNFKPGPLQQTGNPLDLALNDEHSFFAVQFLDPNSKQSSVRLTRDGRFTTNDQGQLVTQSGLRVLDRDDQPIIIQGDAPVRISPAGAVLQRGEEIAQLQVAKVADTAGLRKEGQNLFSFAGPDPRKVQESPEIHPGFVEASSADPIHTLMQLTAATKAATGNAEMIKYFDLLMDRSVNTLGRVA